MNLIGIRQRYHTQKKNLQAILDVATAAGRVDLNTLEARKYDAGRETLAALETELREAEANLENERADITGVRHVVTGEAVGGAARALRQANGLRPFVGRKYADLFPGALDSRGFDSFNEFLKVIHSGVGDPRLFRAAATGQGEDIPSSGGFLVPTEYSAAILDVALESEIIRPRAMVYPMKSETRKIGGLDDLDNSGLAPYGGFSTQWGSEGSTGTLKTAKVRLIELVANKAMIFAFASNELLADGMNFDELIGGALTKSLAWGLDLAFISGDGHGRPLGVLNAPSLIVVAKDTSQPAATLTYSNVSNMAARLHPECKQAIWLASQTCLPALLQMQLVVSNRANTENVGGSAVPIFHQSPDGKFTMLGREVIFSEKMPALGSQGDILLADFGAGYGVGLRREISLERSIHVGWATDESGYRTIARIDGQDRWRAPFKPAYGNTLSWCVTLAAR